MSEERVNQLSVFRVNHIHEIVQPSNIGYTIISETTKAFRVLSVFRVKVLEMKISPLSLSLSLQATFSNMRSLTHLLQSKNTTLNTLNTLNTGDIGGKLVIKVYPKNTKTHEMKK